MAANRLGARTLPPRPKGTQGAGWGKGKSFQTTPYEGKGEPSTRITLGVGPVTSGTIGVGRVGPVRPFCGPKASKGKGSLWRDWDQPAPVFTPGVGFMHDWYHDQANAPSPASIRKGKAKGKAKGKGKGLKERPPVSQVLFHNAMKSRIGSETDETKGGWDEQ